MNTEDFAQLIATEAELEEFPEPDRPTLPVQESANQELKISYFIRRSKVMEN